MVALIQLQPFDNTTRTINVAWDIPAYDLEDAKNNLHKCATLVQMLYPSYSGTQEVTSGGTAEQQTQANTIKKTPLIKLKYANLIANFSDNGQNEGLLGYITSVNWTPQLEVWYVYQYRWKPANVSKTDST